MTQISLREAIERYGNSLIVAGTGAVEKKGRVGEVQVIFDASKMVRVNQLLQHLRGQRVKGAFKRSRPSVGIELCLGRHEIIMSLLPHLDHCLALL